MHLKAFALAAAASTVLAQRPENQTVCDYYTTAVLKNNTAANQLTLLTILVNTVVIGNYTTPNTGIAVPGILAPGDFNGTRVSLLPYFSGALASTNGGGSAGVSVNFLDGGGAAPLKLNKPADDTTSNQYTLLTHLYEFFGTLLGCSMQGNPAFMAYAGSDSMYETHKFMKLSEAEVGYFITQVGLAASSLGVAAADIAPVASALSALFGHRCAPPATVIPAQGAHLQSICTNDSCPLAPKAECGLYEEVAEPSSVSTASSMAGGAMGTGAATATGAGTTASVVPAVAGAGVLKAGMGVVVAVGGFVGLLL